MGIELKYPVGATPLDADDAAALIPSHLTTREQLHEWEAVNIREGEEWAFGRKHENIFSIEFMQVLHKRMFGGTWGWAGKIRKKEIRPIGVAPETIEVELKKLCQDVEVQIEHESWSLDEIAARFHHRLVSIHPFADGNGRFSRTMADLLLRENGANKFSWGAGDLIHAGSLRDQYMTALYAADRREYALLLKFARSGKSET